RLSCSAPAPTRLHTLSLHDALPISFARLDLEIAGRRQQGAQEGGERLAGIAAIEIAQICCRVAAERLEGGDRGMRDVLKPGFPAAQRGERAERDLDGGEQGARVVDAPFAEPLPPERPARGLGKSGEVAVEGDAEGGDVGPAGAT